LLVNPVLQVWYSRSYPSGALRYEDIILNVFLYVPVGVLTAIILRNRALALRLVLPVLLGFVLSYSVETAQVYDATRVPSLLDVIANTAGTLLGAAIALPTTGPLVRLFRWAAEHLEMSRSASAVLMIWYVDRLFPLLPGIGIYTALRKLRVFVTQPGTFTEAGRAFVLYMTLGVLLSRLSRRHATPALLFSLLLVPFEFVLAGRQPRILEMAGAGAGVVTFLLLQDSTRRLRFAAAAAIAFLLVSGLAPYHFQNHPNAFSWTPLEATFISDRFDALRILIGKVTLYGSAVWLLRANGVQTVTAGTFMAVLLALIEFAQRWLPGRTPELTDPLIAVAMAVAFAALDASNRKKRRKGQSTSKQLRAPS
jgi:VanZ family protein